MKRVKIEEKLLLRAYRKSPTIFRMVPSTTPYDLLFPTKIPIAIISVTAKATHFKFSMHRVYSKTFRALIYKAHRAVIFAMPQLSCMIVHALYVHITVVGLNASLDGY